MEEKFKKQLVELSTIQGKKTVSALVFKGMAVHRGISDFDGQGNPILDGSWTVSQVKTGLLARICYSRANAKRVAVAMANLGIGGWDEDRRRNMTIEEKAQLRAMEAET